MDFTDIEEFSKRLVPETPTEYRVFNWKKFYKTVSGAYINWDSEYWPEIIYTKENLKPLYINNSERFTVWAEDWRIIYKSKQD